MMHASLPLHLPGVLVLEIAGVSPEGSPMVFMGDGEAPVEARAVWMGDTPDWDACAGNRAVVVVDEEDERPILLGLLDPPPPRPDPPPPEELRIQSREELIIECGKARIAMRADGRIEIRGGYLISRSSGAIKIKGGSVDIN